MSHAPGQPPRIAIACGGTGGHLFPGLAVGTELRRRGCAVQLLISPKDVDQAAVKGAEGFEIVTLPAVALQRGSRLAFFRGFVQSYLAARRQFKARPPQAALAMGGFTSVPPVLAARRLGTKTFLHESNTIPGRANRVLARWVDVAFTGFAETAARLKCRCVMNTGTPVRPQFQPRAAANCRAQLGLDPARPLVLVTGGSQGARGLNDLVLRALPLLAKDFPAAQWVHLAGTADVERVRAAYLANGLTARVEAFSAQMELLLGAATVAVTRAGASSLAELAAMQLPALLVPLPTAADDHQRGNARAFANGGAARWVEQDSTSAEEFVFALRELAADGPARSQMRAALAQRHAPNAAADIAAQVLAALTESATRASAPARPEVLA